MGQQLCRGWAPGSYWELGPRFIEVRFVRRAPGQPRGGKPAAAGWDVAADGEKVSLIFSTDIEVVRCTKYAGMGGKAEAWKDMQKDLQKDLEKDPILDLQKDLQKDIRLTLVQVLTSSPPSLPHTRCRYHLPPHARWRHHVITLMWPTHAGAGRRGPASGLRHRLYTYLYSVLNFST